MREKISIGDRVVTVGDGTTLKGQVKSVFLIDTHHGHAAILLVAIDTADDNKVDVREVETPAFKWRKDVERPEPTVCESCGHDPNGPFTKKVQELFETFKLAEDPETQESILVELGQEFGRHVDATNLDLPEWMHELVENASDLSFKSHRAWLKLGRTLATRFKESEDQEQSAMVFAQRLSQVFHTGGGGGGKAPSNVN